MKVLPIQWTNADAALSMNIATDLLTGNPNLAGFFSACPRLRSESLRP
jgi:ABC-type sugar transport system substrate-binding protein